MVVNGRNASATDYYAGLTKAWFKPVVDANRA